MSIADLSGGLDSHPILTIVLSSEDLGCNVVGCPAERAGGVTRSDALLDGEREEWRRERSVWRE